jgi:cell division protease FtsH
VDNAFKKAKQILEENIDILHRLTELLIEKETVLGAELDDLIAEMRPDYDFHGRRNVRTTPKQDPGDSRTADDNRPSEPRDPENTGETRSDDNSDDTGTPSEDNSSEKE